VRPDVWTTGRAIGPEASKATVGRSVPLARPQEVEEPLPILSAWNTRALSIWSETTRSSADWPSSCVNRSESKLAPHLTRENCETLLGRAAHRTKREVEELIAEVAPRPDAPTVVRKLPDRKAATVPVPVLRHRSDRGSVANTQLGLDRVELPGLEQTTEASTAGLKSEVAEVSGMATPESPRART